MGEHANFAVGAILLAEDAPSPSLILWDPAGKIIIGKMPAILADTPIGQSPSVWIEARMASLCGALDGLAASGEWTDFQSHVDGGPVSAIKPGDLRYFGMGHWALDVVAVKLDGRPSDICV